MLHSTKGGDSDYWGESEVKIISRAYWGVTPASTSWVISSLGLFIITQAGLLGDAEEQNIHLEEDRVSIYAGQKRGMKLGSK